MNAIDEILGRLHKYPQARHQVRGNRITVFASDDMGFDVSLTDNAPNYTVNFDSWHEEFGDRDQALNAFAFGLSEDCRLRVTLRGKFAIEWSVEEKSESGEWYPCQWIGMSDTGLLLPPLFWLKKRHVYLQNCLLKGQ